MSIEKITHALQIKTELAMMNLGHVIARACQNHGVIFIEGEIGTGKTTLSRGILMELGFFGLVKSPTYTLVESYLLGNVVVNHFDLYRLIDPEELELLGLRDYFVESNVLHLIEWPCMGYKNLPIADLIVKINYESFGRSAELSSGTSHGDGIISYLKQYKG